MVSSNKEQITRSFENQIRRHRFINDELIHNPNVKSIKTGSDDKCYWVKWIEE